MKKPKQSSPGFVRRIDMGDIADAVLDGTLCQCCGVYMGDAVGYPRSCRSCSGHSSQVKKNKVQCAVCKKWVSSVGIKQHMHDKH